MFIDSDIDFSEIEHELVKFNKYKIYDEDVVDLDCKEVRKKVKKLKNESNSCESKDNIISLFTEKYNIYDKNTIKLNCEEIIKNIDKFNKRSKNNNLYDIVSLIVYKDKVVAVSDTTIDDFNINKFCNYIKCGTKYSDIRVIVYKIKKYDKDELLKTLYQNVALGKILIEKIKEKRYLLYFLILITPVMLSVALLFYGVPFDVINIISIAKAFIFTILNYKYTILLFLFFVFVSIGIIFFDLINKKTNKQHTKKLIIFGAIFLIISFIAIPSLPITWLIFILDILIFVIIIYAVFKPFIFLDIYHFYISKYINSIIILFITILYFLVFAIFPFNNLRQIAYKAYLASTGYPKLLIDKEKNKTKIYYLAYEKRGKLYVYDINTNDTNNSKYICKNNIKNTDYDYTCFNKYCVKSFFPKKQHIIYNINDKNISILPFDEDILFGNKSSNNNKSNENNATKKNCNNTRNKEKNATK